MSNNLKINIFFDFQDGPWGGGNQFFKALRKEFQVMGVYEEKTDLANVILFYSYQKLGAVLALKKKYPDKIFVHRLGTVLHYHRGMAWKMIDRLTIKFTNQLADKAIFISEWLHHETQKFGFKNKKYAIIVNAVDPQIFNQAGRAPRQGEKTKLIAVSWSTNPNKGFEIYKYLDDKLDFSKYEMTFIGNAPVAFKNIKTIGPLASPELAEQYKQHDIYLTATEKDAYPNTIAEALASGLPVIAIKSGGNPEAVARGAGELFEGREDVLEVIEKVDNGYEDYKNKISHPNIAEIAQKYIDELKPLLDIKPQKRSIALEIEYFLTMLIFNLKQKINQSIEKIKSLKRASYRYYKFTYHRNLLEGFIQKNCQLIKGKILDIGSKNRRYDQLFKGEITAVDIEPNYEKGVVYGDAQNLDYLDECFDSVVCLEVLCYITDFKKALSEIRRVLKPGGYALISNPFMQHDHGDSIRLTQTALEKELELGGFSRVEVKEYGNGHIAIWDIARKKLTLDKPYLQRKLAFYLILLPWLITLKIFKLDKIQDKYYTGLFVIAKK